MIRFCDKDVYNVTEGEMTRLQLLNFFLQNEMNRIAVIAVYKKEGTYIGKITYNALLESDELEKCIDTDTIMISEDFWEEAKIYFEKEKNRKKLLTVTDIKGKIIGFAYNDSAVNYYNVQNAITILEKGFEWPEQYNRVKMAVITDLNELAWKCYKFFVQVGLAVCVIGEKWEWFGFHSGEGYLNYADYEKLYIYAEGTNLLRYQISDRQSYYINVYDNFYFLKSIAFTNARSIYQKEIKRLEEKGVAICECSIPMVNEIDNITLDEEQSRKLKLDIKQYIDDENNDTTLTDVGRECLYRIYGIKNVITLKEHGEKNIKMVPLGEIQGKSMKGIRFSKRIYLIGPCIASGYGCTDGDTLYGYLQKYVSEYGYQVVVVSIANMRSDIWKYIGSLPLREQDIILSINTSDWFLMRNNNCRLLDMKPIYENKKRGNMFCEKPIHTNAEGNRCIAEEIMRKYLLLEMRKLSSKGSNGYINKGELLNQDGVRTIDEYIDHVRIKNKGCGAEEIGAIVMNGNPFTKGHLYLIEYAAKLVKQLYIFVVEEDRAYFKFADRYQMIMDGTKNIPNVIVVPSGEWILSYKTVPVYFEKERMQEMKVDTQYDLEIFGRYIAPGLGITKRFVGEEPLDAVTRQYNEQMDEILSLFDIKVEIIPRMTINGDIISATRVREYMKEKKWRKLREFVPSSTYEMCRKYMCD